jgi:hypothetical protein
MAAAIAVPPEVTATFSTRTGWNPRGAPRGVRPAASSVIRKLPDTPVVAVPADAPVEPRACTTAPSTGWLVDLSVTVPVMVPV